MRGASCPPLSNMGKDEESVVVVDEDEGSVK